LGDEIDIGDEAARAEAAEELFTAKVSRVMRELHETLLSMKKAGVLSKQDYVSGFLS
jgi:hypothetical protein